MKEAPRQRPASQERRTGAGLYRPPTPTLVPAATDRPGEPMTRRIIPARIVIRPARPDDLEDATLLERRVWGPLSATLNELQRRLFALPEAFLQAEMQRPGLPPKIVGMINGVIWTRDHPRSFAGYEKTLPSSSHNPRGDVLFVVSVAVDPMWRGRGIAFRMVREIADVGRRRHLKSLRLIANGRSQSLYLRSGFQAIRPLPGIYRRHRDLMPRPVLMEMPLP
jgi:ribosomal protein S18 acetylase RimI-like enzyme